MISEETKKDIKKAMDANQTAGHAVLHEGEATAQDVAASTKDRVASAASSVREKAADIASEVKAKAVDAASVIGEKADNVPGTIAGEGHRLAQSLRAAASEQGETVQGRVLDVVAGGVETVSDTIGDRKLSDLFGDVQDYARRNPGTFAIGAAIAGFALARFIRAGERRS